MENAEMFPMHLELKYCERCGGLWLRPQGSDLIYCRGCAKAQTGVAPLWPPTAAGNAAFVDRHDMGGDEPFLSEGGEA